MQTDEDRDRRLEALERRVRVLEDELAIRELLVSYGFAADSGDGPGTAALYTTDSSTVIDHTLVFDGAAGILDLIADPGHQAIIPGSAHVMGPFSISVDGDTAVAVGYATTFTRTEGEVRVWRQSVNRWDCVRERDGATSAWRIARRDSRALIDPSASEHFRVGLDRPEHGRPWPPPVAPTPSEDVQ